MYLNLFQVDELPCVLRVLSYARGEINSRDMSLRGFHLCVCVLKDWDTRKLIIVLSVVDFRKKDRQANGREWGVRLCFSSLKNVPLFSLNPYTA